VTEPIARIEAALERLGAEHEPPAGWEARVLAQIGRAPWWRRLIRWRIAIPIAAAAAVVVVIALRATPAQRELGLVLAYQDTGVVVRGGSHHVGEILRATASGGRGHRAVWIYCEGRLLVACPGGQRCRSSDDATIAELTLDTPGRYTIVALTSSAPLSTSGGILDGDVAAAQAAGASLTYEDVSVR
jgi:hypothetical protein